MVVATGAHFSLAYQINISSGWCLVLGRQERVGFGISGIEFSMSLVCMHASSYVRWREAERLLMIFWYNLVMQFAAL